MREAVSTQQDALVPHLRPLQGPEYLLSDDCWLFGIIRVGHKVDFLRQTALLSISTIIPGIIVESSCKNKSKFYDFDYITSGV